MPSKDFEWAASARTMTAFGQFVPVTIDTEQPELTIKVAYETRGDSLVLLDRGLREGAGQKSGAFASKTAPENLLALIRRIFVHTRYFAYAASWRSRWLN